jgi:AcrR family transcriptional regulator
MGKTSQRKDRPNTTSAKKKEIALARVQGATLSEIGKQVGLSKKTVEKYVADPEVRALMRRYAERHDALIDRSYRTAVERMTEIMQGDDARLALEAVDRLIHLLGATDRAIAPAKPHEQGVAQGGSYTLAELTISLERYVAAMQR